MDTFKRHFSAGLVNYIADQTALYCGRKAADVFTDLALPGLETMEMKQRVQRIADALYEALPGSTIERHAALEAMLHPDVNVGLSRESDRRGIAGWGIWPLSLVVGQHGLEDFEAGLELLREMTQRSTAEFAIRYFLLADQERSLDIMRSWVEDDNEDVRRLVSEGTRPRLPWAMRLPSLIDDPRPALLLIKTLRDDPSEYVRRSVANHINDVAKDHPELVVDIARDWLVNASNERKKMIKHSCRTLIKQGHKEAMALFGFGHPRINVTPIQLLAHSIKKGEGLAFCATISSDDSQTQSLSVDYVLHLLRANGTHTLRVFKGKRISLEPHGDYTSKQTHVFRTISSRSHYSGHQAVCLRINGIDTPPVGFKLTGF